MRAKKSDFSVGLIIITAILIMFGGVIWLKDIKLGSSHHGYTAVFTNIGGLKSGDPVTVNGVKKGSIKKIYLRGEKVAVAFGLDSEVTLTDSSRITIKNVGLLGERTLEISLRSRGSARTPDTEEDTIYIDGDFDSGIAEAIGMFGDILQQATGLVDTVEHMVNQTVASPKFIAFFDDQVDRIDTITALTENFLDGNDEDLTALIGDLKETSAMLRMITTDNRENIQTLADNGAELSRRALLLEQELDTTLTHLKGVSRKIDSGDGTVARLINRSDLTDQLSRTLTAVDSLVAVTDSKGLKLRIKLGFGEKKGLD
ncbi:MAG: MlaD family protein [Fibrobacterota bacterium]